MASSNVPREDVISLQSHTALPRSPLSSTLSARATALDVCYSVYGEGPMSAEAVDHYYEANACDIHRLSRQLSTIDVPKPLAMICILFRLRPPRSNDALFQGLRVWTDILDVCENESFDGHHKAIVEHTLNILLLPGIHREASTSHRVNSSTDSLINPEDIPTTHPTTFSSPSLPIPGTSLSFPSPLHLKLRIVTRLSFNEQGLVTHHRDIWDVKDVVGLLPGVSLAQWIGTRIAATGLSYISRILSGNRNNAGPLDVEQGDEGLSVKKEKNIATDTTRFMHLDY
ncbi:hypothetical protein D9613_004928 [Agrocybe pediades]|uniref:Uncharacterized protein n=1 Tax=Agrocybe pediades TaxID=84607 RepID=A0A8H4QXJ9_9AGAR|nr:hypothetical protein D9613_004928 [Agrocybe pediades]